MSGKPSLEGVQQAYDLLNRMDSHSAAVSSLKGTIEKQTVLLRNSEEELCNAVREFNLLMDRMDVSDTGNWGHEERRNWFLVALIRQVRKEETK